MYLESLLRLAEIVDHYRTTGSYVVDEEFHSDTVKLVEEQTKFLISDLEIKQKDPGPYNFGFGDLVITIYSPDQTDVQEWAALARKGDWQKTYRFNSILGLLKVIELCTEDSSEK